MTYTLYKHTNIITSKSYVGYTYKSMEERWREHIYNSRSYPDKKWKFWNALRKHGLECWEHQVLSTCLSESEAKDMERKFIVEYDSFINGYNSTIGGEGAMQGRKHSLEAIRKMSYAASNRSPEYWRKVSEAKGRMSVEARMNMRNAQLGKTQSSVVRQKMSISSRKPFVIENVNGMRFFISGLKNWCNDNNLNEKTLRATLQNGKFVKIGSSKGWRVTNG